MTKHAHELRKRHARELEQVERALNVAIDKTRHGKPIAQHDRNEIVRAQRVIHDILRENDLPTFYYWINEFLWTDAKAKDSEDLRKLCEDLRKALRTYKTHQQGQESLVRLELQRQPDQFTRPVARAPGAAMAAFDLTCMIVLARVSRRLRGRKKLRPHTQGVH